MERSGREPGDRPEARAGSHRLRWRAARLAGFWLFSGLAVAVAAAVLLLPSYAQTARARYERACAEADIADAEALIAANKRLEAALRLSDPVLLKRLAMRQFRLWPRDEVVVLDPGAPPLPPPDTIRITPASRPAPPSGWLMGLAGRVGRPRTGRGLLLLAAGAFATGVYIISSGRKAGRRSQ